MLAPPLTFLHRPCMFPRLRIITSFFFFNDTATTEIYTLSLHDALPIWSRRPTRSPWSCCASTWTRSMTRSEEHTSELQSRPHLVCRLLLEKKKQTYSSKTMPRVRLVTLRLSYLLEKSLDC